MAVKLPPNHNYCDFTSQFSLMSHFQFTQWT